MEITNQHVTHHLKIYPEHFSAVCTGIKRAELRKNDRNFKVGDTLHLMETPRGCFHSTGEFIDVTITHIADVGEWMPGYVVLSIARAAKDAEPVAFINGAWTLVYYRPPEELGLKIGDKLYAEPPAPVVNAEPVPSGDEDSDYFTTARLMEIVYGAKPKWPEQKLLARFMLDIKQRATPPASVVPDERCQHLSDLYHAQEKRLFKLAQRIKGPSFDKYAYSPSQAIDVLESAIFGDTSDARSAMLNHSEHERDMVQPVSQPYKLPATRFQQVADLYGILVPGGRTTTYSTDAAEASDCRVMGWSVQEYVKLERLQGALTGNSPVIPDGWIPVSERAPEVGQAVLAYRPDAPESDDPLIKMAVYTGKSHHGFNCYCTPTHWMPLPPTPLPENKDE